MSSSANRRPRVAGQRRRPLREDGSVEVDQTTPEAVGDPEAPAAAGPRAEGNTESETEGEGESDNTTEAEADTEGEGAGDGAGEKVARSLALPAVVLAVCLALLAAVLLVTREDPGERARSASAATATARSALEQVLSYNHATMTQQLPASQALLTGAFKEEFGTTMTTTIVPLAQKDKTVVKARVYEAGVMSQADDTVTVQAFVNQARTSDAQKEPSIDQNRVIATMTRSGNRWLVSSLKAY